MARRTKNPAGANGGAGAGIAQVGKTGNQDSTIPPDRVIAEFPKNHHEVYRVTISEFKNENYADLRIWYYSKKGDLRPGKGGLTVRRALIDDFIHGMRLAAGVLDRLEAEDDGGR